MKINPIFQKDMRIMWRSPVFILSVIGVNMVLSVIALVFMAFMEDTLIYWNPVLDFLFRGGGVSQMSPEIGYSSVRALYVLLATVNFLMLLVIVPSMTVGTITWEREHQTLDLLLTTKLAPSKIVLGKLMATINIIFTLMCSTLPIFSLIFVFGGLGLIDLVLLLGVMLVLMIYVGSIGMFCSSFSQKTWRATVANIFFLTFILFGNLIINEFSQTYMSTIGLELISFLLCVGLLLNPALTFISLVEYQLAGNESFVYYLEEFCHISKDSYVANHWLWISMVLQLIFTALFVYISGCHLMPRYKSQEEKLRD